MSSVKVAEKLSILRYAEGKYVPMRDLTVQEVQLHIDIVDIAHKVLYCSPGEWMELVLGHLYTQRYISRISDVESIDIDTDAMVATVEINPLYKDRIIKEDDRLLDNVVFDPEMVIENQNRFYEDSALHRATAGIHRSALCDDDGTLFACIDVSRHNSLDKLIGKALMNGVPLQDKYVLTSGRVPRDMLQKAIYAGLPMVVSRSTPTVQAVRAAQMANLTLIGFSRENRFNIYCGEQRLLGCQTIEDGEGNEPV